MKLFKVLIETYGIFHFCSFIAISRDYEENRRKVFRVSTQINPSNVRFKIIGLRQEKSIFFEDKFEQAWALEA